MAVYSPADSADYIDEIWHSSQHHFLSADYFLAQQSGFHADQIDDGLRSGVYCRNCGLPLCHQADFHPFQQNPP